MDKLNNELDIYNIDCENIENIINKNKPEELEVSVKNDEKYRELRTIILNQKKEIKNLNTQLKILQELVTKN
jgi:hypothetical protein